MSDAEVLQSDGDVQDETPIERSPAAPIESRFLFVDVAALRAKQLRRGAKARLSEGHEGPRPIKPERLAMSEVRNGLVEWDLPDFKVILDNR